VARLGGSLELNAGKNATFQIAYPNPLALALFLSEPMLSEIAFFKPGFDFF
jgi:hypothetical protein